MISDIDAASRFRECIAAEQLPTQLADFFLSLYSRYRSGETGKIPWEQLEPLRQDDVIDGQAVSDSDPSRHKQLLDQLVCIKLNGGLGTSMKLQYAKSLIPVRSGHSFLALSIEQTRKLRELYGVRTPMVLMNSFNTQADTLAAIKTDAAPFPGSPELPIDFVQHKFPRIDRDTGGPVALSDVNRNWAPPGHGDIYLAIQLSGMLQQLIDAGFKWAFVSNIDNLGATVDPNILAALADREIDFAMEVTDKTLADVKGGTLIRYNQAVTLLERAQVEANHIKEFEDIKRFPYFNTNTFWWRLDAIQRAIEQKKLQLPLIVNPKSEEGRNIVQLETAMGAGIGCFENSVGVRVPRTRFAPVKTTNDLLAVQSDAYALDDDGGLRPSPSRAPAWGPPVIRLDERYYKAFPEFEKRCPHPLSLIDCESLSVNGDIRFGKSVTISGHVTLSHDGDAAADIPDGTVFASGEYSL